MTAPTLPCTIERGPEGFRIMDADGRMWADGFGGREAPFLLAAINSHADLLRECEAARAALRNACDADAIAEWWLDTDADGFDLDALLNGLDAAIAKASGGVR